MIKVWGIKNCQSVKKALDFLNEKGVGYEFIDYKKTPPSLALLQEWVKQSGIDVVFNQKSATFRTLGLKDKDLGLQEKIALMQENPTLIKRPVLEMQNGLKFGFCKEEYEGLV